LGAVPIAFGSGVGGEARRPLGIAVIGGLLLSQSLTLYLTPVLYLQLHRFQRKRLCTLARLPSTRLSLNDDYESEGRQTERALGRSAESPGSF
jgi:hypothetical protein